MKISRITKQKKGQRYNIFLKKGQEESFGFGVDEDILVKYHLHKGMEIDQALIETLKEQDSLQKYYQLAIRYLSYRMRSILEMEQYLRKKEVDDEYIYVLIDRLKQEGLLNDLEFAQAFVRERIRQSTKGPQFVRQELINLKGVSPKLAAEAVQQYSFDLELESASKLARRHKNRQSRESLQKRIQKLQAALQRNGFSQEVIREVIDQTRTDLDGQHDEASALEIQAERLYTRLGRKYEGRELRQRLFNRLYQQGFPIDQINEFLKDQLDGSEEGEE